MALSHEVRLAWRSLLKDRSFLVFAVGALALGVAASPIDNTDIAVMAPVSR